MQEYRELYDRLEKNGITVKTIGGWHEFAEKTRKGDWNEYCKPGDYVGEDVYNYFLDIMPPISMGKNYLQVGEPNDHFRNPRTGKFQATYATFKKIQKGLWIYCGNCFAGDDETPEVYKNYGNIRKFLKETYREHLGMTARRPRVRCNDGFEISVQAGCTDYCFPRENLPDGNYESCELGYPSQPDEMIEEYAEIEDDLRKTVYGWVPVEIIDRLIQKHGGFYDARMPHVREKDEERRTKS